MTYCYFRSGGVIIEWMRMRMRNSMETAVTAQSHTELKIDVRKSNIEFYLFIQNNISRYYRRVIEPIMIHLLDSRWRFIVFVWIEINKWIKHSDNESLDQAMRENRWY